MSLSVACSRTVACLAISGDVALNNLGIMKMVIVPVSGPWQSSQSTRKEAKVRTVKAAKDSEVAQRDSQDGTPHAVGNGRVHFQGR